MDRGTWQATVHWVAKRQTWLKQVSTHTHQQRGLFLGLWGKVLRVESTLGILGGMCAPRWGRALCQLTLGEQWAKYPQGGGGSEHCCWEELRLEQLAELLGAWRAGCLSMSLMKPRKAPPPPWGPGNGWSSPAGPQFLYVIYHASMSMSAV